MYHYLVQSFNAKRKSMKTFQGKQLHQDDKQMSKTHFNSPQNKQKKQVLQSFNALTENSPQVNFDFMDVLIPDSQTLEYSSNQMCFLSYDASRPLQQRQKANHRGHNEMASPLECQMNFSDKPAYSRQLNSFQKPEKTSIKHQFHQTFLNQYFLDSSIINQQFQQEQPDSCVQSAKTPKIHKIKASELELSDQLISNKILPQFNFNQGFKSQNNQSQNALSPTSINDNQRVFTEEYCKFTQDRCTGNIFNFDTLKIPPSQKPHSKDKSNNIAFASLHSLKQIPLEDKQGDKMKNSVIKSSFLTTKNSNKNSLTRKQDKKTLQKPNPSLSKDTSQLSSSFKIKRPMTLQNSKRGSVSKQEKLISFCQSPKQSLEIQSIKSIKSMTNQGRGDDNQSSYNYKLRLQVTDEETNNGEFKNSPQCQDIDLRSQNIKDIKFIENEESNNATPRQDNQPKQVIQDDISKGKTEEEIYKNYQEIIQNQKASVEGRANFNRKQLYNDKEFEIIQHQNLTDYFRDEKFKFFIPSSSILCQNILLVSEQSKPSTLKHSGLKISSRFFLEQQTFYTRILNEDLYILFGQLPYHQIQILLYSNYINKPIFKYIKPTDEEQIIIEDLGILSQRQSLRELDQEKNQIIQESLKKNNQGSLEINLQKDLIFSMFQSKPQELSQIITNQDPSTIQKYHIQINSDFQNQQQQSKQIYQLINSEFQEQNSRQNKLLIQQISEKDFQTPDIIQEEENFKIPINSLEINQLRLIMSIIYVIFSLNFIRSFQYSQTICENNAQEEQESLITQSIILIYHFSKVDKESSFL